MHADLLNTRSRPLIERCSFVACMHGTYACMYIYIRAAYYCDHHRGILTCLACRWKDFLGHERMSIVDAELENRRPIQALKLVERRGENERPKFKPSAREPLGAGATKI